MSKLNLRLFLDECISHSISRKLQQQTKYRTTSVKSEGMNGQPDNIIYDFCIKNKMCIITANGKDFIELIQKHKKHTGMIYVRPGGLSKEDQLEAILRAVKYIEKKGVANTLVEVRKTSGKYVCRKIDIKTKWNIPNPDIRTYILRTLTANGINMQSISLIPGMRYEIIIGNK